MSDNTNSKMQMSLSYRKGNSLALVCSLSSAVPVLAIISGIVAAPLWAGIIVSVGLAFVVILLEREADPPIERFTLREVHDRATYRGLSLDTTIEIKSHPETSLAPMKRRVVRIVARDGDEEIVHRAVAQTVGSLAWPLTGDFGWVQSNSAHVAAVADTLKEDIDKHLAVEGRNTEIQAGLEAGFDGEVDAELEEVEVKDA